MIWARLLFALLAILINAPCNKFLSYLVHFLVQKLQEDKSVKLFKKHIRSLRHFSSLLFIAHSI